MKNALLLLLVVALAVLPLLLHRPAPEGAEGAEGKAELFTGSDSQAEEAIGKIAPDYKPWFAPLWEPPSVEIESLLFTLQGVLGAGVLFYFLGYIRGRSAALKRTGGGNDSP